MRNKLSGVLWGIMFIAAGIGFAGNALNLWGFELFFDGWWTLFIIIPCIISMVQNGVNVGNIIGVAIGVLLLLSAQKIIDHNVVGKLIFPIVLVIIGLGILFRGSFRKSGNPDVIEVENLNRQGLPEYTAIFGGQDVRFSGQKFKGADIVAIFGGVDFDLKDAVIDQDVTIQTTTIFGGVEMLMPPNVKVKVSSTPIFGGVSNKVASSPHENTPTVYVHSTCIFGGVEIK